MRSVNNQVVAPGLYLFTVEDTSEGVILEINLLENLRLLDNEVDKYILYYSV